MGVQHFVARDIEILGKCFLLAFRLSAIGLEPIGFLLARALQIADDLSTSEAYDRLFANFEKNGPMAMLPAFVGEFRINFAILMHLVEVPIIARDAARGVSEAADMIQATEFATIARTTVVRMHEAYLAVVSGLDTLRHLDPGHKAEAIARRLVAEQYVRRLKAITVAMVGADEHHTAAFRQQFFDPDCPQSPAEERQWHDMGCLLDDVEIVRLRDVLAGLHGHSEFGLLAASSLLGECSSSLSSDFLGVLEKQLEGPFPEPATWARGVGSILAAERDPQTLVGLLMRAQATCARLSPEAAFRARAHLNLAVVEAVSRVAPVQPLEAAAVISAFAYPGLRPLGDGEARVWVLSGSAEGMALIQSKGSTVLVAIPDLNMEYISNEVGGDFAEEFDGGYSSSRASNMRNELSRQFRPLIADLETRTGATRVIGLGYLKHVPFAGLKRSDGSLATRPQLMTLTSRATVPYERPAGLGTPRTLLLVDQSFASRPSDPKAGWCTFRSFSSAAGMSTYDDLLGDLDDFDRFVFFGHAQVGQFEMDGDGLVLAERPGDQRLLFRLTLPPVGTFARLREVILIACAAGQAKVFVDAAESLASRFVASGVGYVVAPIWPITDQIGSRFINQWLGEENIDPSRPPVDTWGRVIEKDPNSFLSFAYFG